MARYEVLIKTSAAKDIEDLPNRKDRRRIAERIGSLGGDPRSPGCQKLSGQDRCRVRQGVYRIVYSILDESLVVQVVKVGHGPCDEGGARTRSARGLRRSLCRMPRGVWAWTKTRRV